MFLLRLVAEDAVLHRTVRHDGRIPILSHVAGHAFPGWVGGDMKVMLAQLRRRSEKHIDQTSRQYKTQDGHCLVKINFPGPAFLFLCCH